MRAVVALAALLAPVALAAQVVPVSEQGDARIKTAYWEPGEEYLLTALPQTGLTVVFEAGERIERVAVEDETALDVRLSAALDGFLVIPRRGGTTTGMAVGTDRRRYVFRIRAAADPGAAYLVRFDYSGSALTDGAREELGPAAELTGERIWSYRLKGDDEVLPRDVRDDGTRTIVRFAANQALPAIFAIGPSGEEQVVNGYMREGVYVIDRVFDRLVFRIDEEKATARRRDEPEQAGG